VSFFGAIQPQEAASSALSVSFSFIHSNGVPDGRSSPHQYALRPAPWINPVNHHQRDA
jgi:hypothetical protein